MQNETKSGPEATLGPLKQQVHHQNPLKMVHLVWGSSILWFYESPEFGPWLLNYFNSGPDMTVLLNGPSTAKILLKCHIEVRKGKIFNLMKIPNLDLIVEVLQQLGYIHPFTHPLPTTSGW